MKKRGFTLIEMLIVIVIIGILAGALIPRIGNARDKANDVAIQANVNALASAGMQAIMDDRAPCGDGNVVNYANMASYGMSDYGDANYHCTTRGDHIVAWYNGMHVDDNENCLEATVTALAANADVAAILAVVGAEGNHDSYCIAQ